MNARASSFLLLIFIGIPFVLQAAVLVNINTADKEELMTLNGIGEVKAQAIIEYRETNGPFQNIEDIQNVSGIGPATYANIKEYITVAGGDEQQETQPENSHNQNEEILSSQTGGHPSIEPQIQVDAGGDRTVIVGADTLFEGHAFTKDGEPIGPMGIRFLWNFGDGKTAEGHSVFHGFAHPGRYVVTLSVSADKYAAADRFTVTAKPAEFLLTYLSDGSAVIENKTDRELNLSFWFVKNGGEYFALPEDTIVLVQEKIIIPPASLNFSVGSGWQLLYPNGEVAETAAPPKPRIIHAPADSGTSHTAAKTVSSPVLETESEEESDRATSTVQVAAAAAVSNDGNGGWLNTWTAGFAALTLIGAVGTFFASRAKRKDWDIQEIEENT